MFVTCVAQASDLFRGFLAVFLRMCAWCLLRGCSRRCRAFLRLLSPRRRLGLGRGRGNSSPRADRFPHTFCRSSSGGKHPEDPAAHGEAGARENAVAAHGTTSARGSNAAAHGTTSARESQKAQTPKIPPNLKRALKEAFASYSAQELGAYLGKLVPDSSKLRALGSALRLHADKRELPEAPWTVWHLIGRELFHHLSTIHHPAITDMLACTLRSAGYQKRDTIEREIGHVISGYMWKNAGVGSMERSATRLRGLLAKRRKRPQMQYTGRALKRHGVGALRVLLEANSHSQSKLVKGRGREQKAQGVQVQRSITTSLARLYHKADLKNKVSHSQFKTHVRRY